jgi:hypothetical protein
LSTTSLSSQNSNPVPTPKDWPMKSEHDSTPEHTPDLVYTIPELHSYCVAHNFPEAQTLTRYLTVETPTKRPTQAWSEALRTRPGH